MMINWRYLIVLSVIVITGLSGKAQGDVIGKVQRDIITGLSGKVQGEEYSQDETVTTRKRPELDPLGIHTGGFQLYPALTLAETHADNIYATNKDEKHDYITGYHPELTLKSNWNRNALNLYANADIGRYSDYGDEDYTDYSVGTDGRLDVERNDYLTGAIDYARKHVPRSSPDDRRGVKPTKYDVGSISAAYKHSINRLSFKFGGALDRLDYQNVPGLFGTIDNHDQDRDVVEIQAKINYELQPSYSAFIRTGYKNVNYNEKFDNSGLQRSNNGYSVDIGSDLFLTGLISGEVYAGYLTRDYDDPALKNIDTFTGGGRLTWIPTGLTTVNLSLTREIYETTVSTASGNISTKAGVVVDHELLRNLLLNVSLGARRDNFKGIDRNDDYQELGIGGKYLMNRYLYLSLGYSYINRNSNTNVNDFTENMVWLAIRGQI